MFASVPSSVSGGTSTSGVLSVAVDVAGGEVQPSLGVAGADGLRDVGVRHHHSLRMHRYRCRLRASARSGATIQPPRWGDAPGVLVRGVTDYSGGIGTMSIGGADQMIGGGISDSSVVLMSLPGVWLAN